MKYTLTTDGQTTTLLADGISVLSGTEQQCRALLRERQRADTAAAPKYARKYAHYTNFGCTSQPHCTDAEGYLAYRDGYSGPGMTEAEQWIAAACDRIADWQRNG